MYNYKPIFLIVMDGWGLGKTDQGNAIAHANLPTIQKLNSYYPLLALQASGISVGLPWGEEGNSEVGHMTLGAGKIIYQNMPKITMAIQTGVFFQNPAFLKASEHVKANNSALHLMGLVGKGSTHSYIDHLYALLELAKQQEITNVFIHVFTDGRDSAPDADAEVVFELQKKIKEIGVGKIASLCGRNFAMDRNNNWDRILKAYNLLTKGEGEKITDPIEFLKKSYEKKVFDEYIEPTVVTENNVPVATIKDNDAIIFFNFREDRARQITATFINSDFQGFERKKLENLKFVAMTQYEKGLQADIAFPPDEVGLSLGGVLSANNLKQYRIAETEKFAHVTYFFNGGAEEPFPGEDREIIPSKVVDTFDKAPEMSAEEVTKKVSEALGKNIYSFFLINFANPDMVGHTGNEPATIKAVEKVDECLSRIIPSVLAKNGCLLITADHGNAEELSDPATAEINTQHSTNPVPCWFITPENHRLRQPDNNLQASGLLSDIAPTVLELLNIPKPPEMTGQSLLKEFEKK